MQLAAEPRPRFRTDLVAECIEANGQRFIDVIDPDTGDSFRFYEVEYSLACAMDGRRDIPGLVQWAREELGIEPSPTELAQVISTLGTLGYLGGGDAEPEVAVAAAAATPGRAPEPATPAPGLTQGWTVPETGLPPVSGLTQGWTVPETGLPPVSGLTQGWTVPETGLPPMEAAPATPPRAPAVELGTPGLTQGWTVPETGLPPVAEIELGKAGGVAAAPVAHAPAVDLELGLPGAGGLLPPVEPTPSLRRTSNPSSDEDGPTNLPLPDAGDASEYDDGVSMNLGDHLAVRPDDVKEAVRLSQSMAAVDPAVIEELARKEAAEAAAALPVAAVPPREPVAPPPVVTPVAQTAVEPASRLEPRPVARPGDARPTESTAAQPAGTSNLLIALLVLALLGAAAFFVWKYVLDKPSAEGDESTEVQPRPPVTEPGGTTVIAPVGSGSAEPGAAVGSGSAEPGAAVGSGSAEPGAAVGSGSAEPGAAVGSGSAEPGAGSGSGSAEPGAGSGSAPPVPPPVAPPTAMLTAIEGVAAVKAVAAGVVEFAVKPGAAVKAGSVVVRLKGGAAIERKIGNAKEGLVWDVESRYPNEIEKATAARDKATAAGDAAEARKLDVKIKERAARLEEQRAKLAALRAELANLALVAPSDGVVAAAPKPGARLVAGQDAVTFQGGAGLTATFDVGAAVVPAVGAQVSVVSAAAAGQPAACTVSAVEGARVTVACAADAGLAPGEVTLASAP